MELICMVNNMEWTPVITHLSLFCILCVLYRLEHMKVETAIACAVYSMVFHEFLH